MLAFNHILAGSIIAAIVPAPAVPVVAFVAHFVMDLFPHAHGEEKPFSRFLKIQIAIDAMVTVAAIILVAVLFSDRLLIIGMGAFFCLLPDFLWLLWGRGPKWLDKFLDFAHLVQWGERPYGWIFDVFYGFVMIVILFHLAS